VSAAVGGRASMEREPAALSQHPAVLGARARATAALRVELRALTDRLGAPPPTPPPPPSNSRRARGR
jgi:hypothetical protein